MFNSNESGKNCFLAPMRLTERESGIQSERERERERIEREKERERESE